MRNAEGRKTFHDECRDELAAIMSEQSGIIEMKEPETPKSAPKEKESIIDTTVISEVKTAKTVNHS